MRAINQYRVEVASTPLGAASEILRILQLQHRGQIHAILGKDLLIQLKDRGYDLRSIRQLMQKINELRKDGNLIGASNASGGYYWISSQDELEEFFSRQIFSRIGDLKAVYEAMRQRAELEFAQPIALQPDLFSQELHV